MKKLESLTRESIKQAIADGMTPADVIRELADESITTNRKLYAAIRRLYDYPAYAEKLVTGLQNNMRKPVLAAPHEEEATNEADVQKPSSPEPTDAKVEVAPSEDANEPVAETPAAGTVKPASQVPENPANDPTYVSKYTKRALNIAAQNGCVVDSDYIVNFYDELIKLPLDTVYIPLFVLNSLRKLVEVGRLSKEVLERIEFLEQNVHVMKEAPADIVIVDSSAKQRSVLFAKHVVNVRRTSCPSAIALTKSYEVRNLLSDYENANN